MNEKNSASFVIRASSIFPAGRPCLRASTNNEWASGAPPRSLLFACTPPRGPSCIANGRGAPPGMREKNCGVDVHEVGPSRGHRDYRLHVVIRACVQSTYSSTLLLIAQLPAPHNLAPLIAARVRAGHGRLRFAPWPGVETVIRWRFTVTPIFDFAVCRIQIGGAVKRAPEPRARACKRRRRQEPRTKWWRVFRDCPRSDRPL